MTNRKIILFLCCWGPHAAYQELQDNGFHMPAEMKIVRVPCAGGISRDQLFKPFEMGADGVALVGCAPGTCRHGAGSTGGRDNVEAVENINALMGLGRQRIRLATFLPDEADGLKSFLSTFCNEIRKLGKLNPRSLSGEQTIPESLDTTIAAIVREHDVHSCQDCGKCTSSCPLALSGKEFSPRTIAGEIIRGKVKSERLLTDIQSCLTCGVCHERCPSDVNFPEFIRDMRRCIHDNFGESTALPHGGFFQSMMRTMGSPDVSPSRWTGVAGDIQLDRQGKILFFGGCAPYFDAFFQNHRGMRTADILTDGLRLLNFFDVAPQVSPAERCCGHDLLWSGDRENFLRLAQLNVEMIRDTGVEEVITACPECYRTLAVDYEANGVRTGIKVTHLYEFLETEIGRGGVAFHPLEKKITYQDSCRLNRLEEHRTLPRRLLHRLNCAKFTEMQDAGRSALCCGNCAWTRCDAYSKALQVKRIRQARKTGSDCIVTSCPKCQIHLRCAMEDPVLGQELLMDIIDLTSVLAKTIYRE